MKRFAFAVGLIAILEIFLATVPSAQAAFHLWKIDEVFSNSDGSVQFIELTDPSDFENSTTGQQLKSSTATVTVPTNLPSFSTSNHHMLFATAGFGALAGGVTPDYIIPAHFFNPAGDTLSWAGGADFQTIPPISTNGVSSLTVPAHVTVVNSPTNFAGASGSVRIVPEPSTLALAGAGFLLIALRRLKRRAYQTKHLRQRDDRLLRAD